MWRDQTERLLTQTDFNISEKVAGQEQRCQSRYNLSFTRYSARKDCRTGSLCCAERSALPFPSVWQIKSVMGF